jgi:hypothetical protein
VEGLVGVVDESEVVDELLTARNDAEVAHAFVQNTVGEVRPEGRPREEEQRSEAIPQHIFPC